MNRRELLEWASRGLATGVATLVGLPGVSYFLGGDQRESSTESQFSRLVKVKDLIPGRPIMVPVMGQKQDAWIQSDRQAIGRVWLVRDADSSLETGSAKQSVRALSSICPHMGCQLQVQSGGKNFVCPCHRASFGVDGQRLPDPKTGERNHVPRDLDELECRLVRDDETGDNWVEVKYEKFKTGLDHRVAGA
jgi:menaquinol-cytochrome c reductase iron-sulfur subunit